MAGEYSRARQRTGGLAAALEPLKLYLQQEREKREQEEGMKNLLNAFNRSRRTIDQLDPNYKPPNTGMIVNPSEPTQNKNVLGVDNIETANNNLQQFGMPQIINTKPVQQQTNDKNVLSPSPNKNTLTPYQIAQDEINDFLVKAIMNPKIDKERTNVLSGVLGNTAEKFKPETYTRTQEDPTKNTIIRDSKGNIVKEIPGKQKNEYGWTTIGTGNKNGKKIATQENKITGERREIELGEKEQTGTTVNNITAPDYSGLYAKTTKGIKEIEEFKNREPDEIKDGKKYYKNSEGNFVKEEDFIKAKEKKKREYTESAIEMIKKYDIKTGRALSEPNGPIETIRKDINNGTSKEDAIRNFKKYNPDLTGEEEDLLDKYFTIHLL